MIGHLEGLLKVRVMRGVNLAIRDLRSSDLYVAVRMGKQEVFDKDMSMDDRMGDAEVDIRPMVEVVETTKLHGVVVADNVVVKTVAASRQNCLAEESAIYGFEGSVKRNVERGEIELQLLWIHIPASASKF